jgi:hypothetical protein
VDLFGLDASGRPWVDASADTAGSSWQWLTSTYPGAMTDLATGIDAQGNLDVFALYGGNPWVDSDVTASGGGSGWGWLTSTLPTPLTDLMSGKTVTGALDLFGLDSVGSPWIDANADTAGSNWQLVAASFPTPFTDLATGNDVNGNLDVLALDGSTPWVDSGVSNSGSGSGWGWLAESSPMPW